MTFSRRISKIRWRATPVWKIRTWMTVELLYPTDEAAEHCIKEFLALRLDDDNEHELEQ